MPLGTVYNILTRYRVDDNGATRSVNRLSAAFGRLYDQAKWIIGGGLAIGAGLGVAQMTRLGVQAEKSKIAIAGTFQVLSEEASTFEQQLARADDLFKRFSERSITSPASRSEFRQLFQGVAPAVGGLGLSNEKMAQFTQRSVGAAVAFTGQDYEQAGRDIRRILKGRAGAQVKTFTNLKKPLLDALGASTVEEFNKIAKQDPSKTFEAVNQALKQTDPMLEEFSNSTAGLFATVKELVNRGLLEAWKGFGAAIRGELEDVIEWYKKNEGTIRQTARVIGAKLGTGLQLITDVGASAARNLDKIVSAMAAISAMRTGLAIRRGLLGAIERSGSMLDDLSSFAEEFAGSPKEMLMRAAFGLASLVAVAGVAVSVFGSFQVLQSDLQSVNHVMDNFALLAHDLREGAVGAAEAVDRAAGIVKEEFIDALDELWVRLQATAQQLGFRNATEMAMTFAKSIGVFLVGAFAGAIQATALFLSVLNEFPAAMATTVEVISRFIRALPGGSLLGAVGDVSAHAIRQLEPVSDAKIKGLKEKAKQGEGLGQKLKDTIESFGESTKEKENQGSGDVNMDVTINQQIETEQDPDRIALRTGEGLSKAVNGETPKTGSAPAYGR